jgi:hypothetical protein
MRELTYVALRPMGGPCDLATFDEMHPFSDESGIKPTDLFKQIHRGTRGGRKKLTTRE